MRTLARWDIWSVNKITAFDILRSEWMVLPSAIDLYREAVATLLAGREIPVGMFASLPAPSVPDNVGMVVMSGVLTKSDVCGSIGTRSMANNIDSLAADPNISSIILYAENCPGGQVDGTHALAQSVKAAAAKKPVIGMISGVNASAGVWAMVHATEIHATSPTDSVGCIGTVAMIRRPKADGDFVEVYSDLSPDKNGEYKDPEKLKAAFLNPLTELFHNEVKAGRCDKLSLDKENVLSGKTYIAADAKKYGLIDSVMPMNKVIARAVYLGRTNKK